MMFVTWWGLGVSCLGLWVGILIEGWASLLDLSGVD